MTIEEINALGHGEFIARLGWIFEHAPWVAERAWDARPFLDAEHLHQAMTQCVERATRPEQLALLRAHPDLGTRARVSAASAAEQQGAGLDQLTIAEHERLMRRNHAYARKFGFPFIYAVKDAAKQDILKALEQRLAAPEDREFEEALRQVYRIARFRLASAIE